MRLLTLPVLYAAMVEHHLYRRARRPGHPGRTVLSGCFHRSRCSSGRRRADPQASAGAPPRGPCSAEMNSSTARNDCRTGQFVATFIPDVLLEQATSTTRGRRGFIITVISACRSSRHGLAPGISAMAIRARLVVRPSACGSATNGDVEVAADDVQVGDEIRVKPGEKIPSTGEIVRRHLHDRRVDGHRRCPVPGSGDRRMKFVVVGFTSTSRSSRRATRAGSWTRRSRRSPGWFRRRSEQG